MDYNPRMSMARSQQPASQQKQRKEPDEDAFMTLVWTTQRDTSLSVHD
jgi:kinetochore protein Nuf2